MMHDAAISAVVFSNDGEYIASGDVDGTIKVRWLDDWTPCHSRSRTNLLAHFLFLPSARQSRIDLP